MVSSDASWHLKKRESIIKKHPEIVNLRGPFYPSICIIIILVVIQWILWIYIQNVHFLYIGFFAWINANTFYYSLSSFIHENSHGLVLGWKHRLITAVFIEMGTLLFGESWEYTHVHYFMHHPHLNDQSKDSECPGIGHVAFLPRSPLLRIIIPLIELLPLGFLLTINPSNNSNKSFKRAPQQNVLLAVSLAMFAILLYCQMWKSVLFAIWSLSFFNGRWCISLHGQSIAEHYSRHTGKDTSPSKSTYRLFTNLLGFNTGYHDEHHTFPNVAWFYLPRIREMCPDEFQNENPYSYLELWLKWVWNWFDTECFRLCDTDSKVVK